MYNVNGTKYNYDVLIPFNITTDVEVNSSWFQIDLNGTNYSMGKASTLNWNSSIANLTGGYNLITFFANDSLNNIANASAYFYVTYEKNLIVRKNMTNTGNNSYSVSLNITNNGKYIYYDIHDFIDSNFTYYNLSLAVQNLSNVSGSFYNGKILKWNLTLPQYSSTLITYNLNGTGDNYALGYGFMVGSE